MRHLDRIANVAILIAATLSLPSIAFAKNPAPAPGQSPQTSEHASDLLWTLNKEAAASDPAGIRAYSQHLIELLVPDTAGNDYLKAFSDRLAQSELNAREGRGKLIPEESVVRAFNELMDAIRAPKSFRTNKDTLHRFRASSLAITSAPAVISFDRNGDNCNPSEAVFLLFLLLNNNGGLSDLLLTGARHPAPENSWTSAANEISPAKQTAARMLSLYSAENSPQKTIRIFNRVGRTLGF